MDAGDVEVAFGRRLFGHVTEEFLAVLVPPQGVEDGPVQVVIAVERVVRPRPGRAGHVDADDVQGADAAAAAACSQQQQQQQQH